jgi:hypothetical protein
MPAPDDDVPTFDLPDVLPPLLVGYQIVNDDGDTVVMLPLPGDLGRAIQAHVERDVAALRAGAEARGGVLAPQDLFRPLRHLRQADELLAEYMRVLGEVRKAFALLIEEVAADAVGADADGKPTGTVTVPDQDGDITVRPQFRNSYTITPEVVLPAFAAMFADQHADAVLAAAGSMSTPDIHEYRNAVGAAMAEAIADALANAHQLGKYDLQVSKVRAYADHLARTGHDSAASVVEKAIHKTRDYTGIKVERKTT